MSPNDLSLNGNETAGTAEQARAFFDSLETVNLDEVTTSTIRVALRDVDPDRPGKYLIRHADIENFVPMRVFNRMLASRSRVMKQRAAYLDGKSTDDTADPMLGWMLEQVLAVWQQTEPDMTRERLEDGLTFEQTSKLFTRFFGHLLRQMTK